MKRKAELILALDVDSLKEAGRFVDQLFPKVKFFKIGAQLFTGYGPEAVRLVQKKKAKVFLDLKFFDIPNTMSNACIQAVRLKVDMLTLHINAGKEALKQAVKATLEESKRMRIKKPLLLGVTVLTSKKASSDEVVRLAEVGLDCGLEGVVASAQEVSILRQKIKRDFVIVTPGIRSSKEKQEDQKRVATAEEAVRAGSDFLVVGRPILKADDPLQEANEFINQIKISASLC